MEHQKISNLLNEPDDSKKNDGKTIDDAEDLDLVMRKYNLIEYSSTILKQPEFYVFIQKMEQLILIQILLITIISNLSNILLNY